MAHSASFYPVSFTFAPHRTVDIHGGALRYFAILFLVGLLLACGSGRAAQPTIVPSPVAMPVPTDAPEPTIAVAATNAPAAAPTDAPARTPIIIPTLAGAAPKGSDCPADHPVKGNIVDRGDNKGDKIYHLPSSSSYQATKPERCFVDATEAESAGFRAPK